MPDHTPEFRAQVVKAIVEAERDREFRRVLQEDPETALARFGIVIGDLHRIGVDDPDPPDPGCNDGTCFTSECPATCYVTVCGTSGFAIDPAEEIVAPEILAALDEQFREGV